MASQKALETSSIDIKTGLVKKNLDLSLNEGDMISYDLFSGETDHFCWRLDSRSDVF
jgi:hypothetical protein